jgi:FkbM family methyltransferase
MKAIAQAITDAWAAPQRTWLRGSKGRKLRRWILKFHDPAVRYVVDGFELELPFSHMLPVYRRECPRYDTALARLARAAAASLPGGGAILDVGANVGDSAATLRSACDWPILCVEGEPKFSAYLRANAPRIGGALVLEQVYLGAEDAVLEARAVSDKGTSRLETSGGERIEVVSLKTLLARHPELPTLRLVKVDTDGFDWPILEAGLDTLVPLRPILFYECDAKFYPEGWDPRPLWRRLAAAGYQRLVAYENTGELHSVADAADEVALANLLAYLRLRKGAKYLDICAFHDADAALADAFIRSELAHFGVELPSGSGQGARWASSPS